MFSSCLQWIISSEFEKNVGRWQVKKDKQISMDLSFSLSPFYDFESGYRRLRLRIFADMNYVAILVKEYWNVLPHEYAEYDEEREDTFIKEGKDYITGDSGWYLVSYHDSCWRDAIDDVLRAYRDRIILIDTLFESYWYVKTELSEGDQKEIQEIIRMRDNGDMSKHFNAKECLLPIKEPTKEKTK